MRSAPQTNCSDDWNMPEASVIVNPLDFAPAPVDPTPRKGSKSFNLRPYLDPALRPDAQSWLICGNDVTTSVAR
jgi:hypothetical protein